MKCLFFVSYCLSSSAFGWLSSDAGYNFSLLCTALTSRVFVPRRMGNNESYVWTEERQILVPSCEVNFYEKKGFTKVLKTEGDGEKDKFAVGNAITVQSYAKMNLPSGWTVRDRLAVYGSYVVLDAEGVATFTVSGYMDYATLHVNVRDIEDSEEFLAREKANAEEERRKAEEPTAMDKFDNARSHYHKTVRVADGLVRAQGSVNKAYDEMIVAYNLLTEEEQADIQLPKKAIMTIDRVW